VITVPAYFQENERQAIKKAAQIAGWDVIRLVNEPTAAAVAYGLDQEAQGTYLVYDFGGGTFDVSILNLTKGVFQVIATGGDPQLGGDDIDSLILSHWENLYHRPFQTTQDRLLARQAKEFIATSSDPFDQFGVLLTYQTLEQLVSPLIEKTLLVCEQILKDANQQVEDLSGIILVGGSTRLPWITEQIRHRWGRSPLTGIDPDKIVAFGAAWQGYHLCGGEGALLLDITPLSLGIETYGGLVEKIIPRNTPVPIAIAQEFTTFEAGQTAMTIHVVQGEREFVKDCISLGQFTLEGIPPMAAGAARIRVIFRLDPDGLLIVEAIEKSTGQTISVEMKPTFGLTQNDFERLIREGYEKGSDDIQSRIQTQYRIQAEQLVRYVQEGLKTDSHLLLPSEQKEIQRRLDDLIQALETRLGSLQELIQSLSNQSQILAERQIEAALKNQSFEQLNDEN